MIVSEERIIKFDNRFLLVMCHIGMLKSIQSIEQSSSTLRSALLFVTIATLPYYITITYITYIIYAQCSHTIYVYNICSHTTCADCNTDTSSHIDIFSYQQLEKLCELRYQAELTN